MARALLEQLLNAERLDQWFERMRGSEKRDAATPASRALLADPPSPALTSTRQAS